MNLLKYGLNVVSKEEGYIIIQKSTEEEKRLTYLFIPDTKRPNFFQKGIRFSKEDIKHPHYEDLAIYVTSLFITDEDFYINVDGMLVGNTKEENIQFFSKPIKQEFAF